MIAPLARRLDALDGALAPLAVVALGCGTLMTLAGAAMNSPTVAIPSAVVTAAALVYLMAGDLVDPLIVLLLSLPLPGLLVQTELRLVLAAPLTACVLAAWFLHWGPTRQPIRYGRLPKASLLAFAGAYLLAGAASSHPLAAIREVANMVALLLLVVVATDLLSRRPARRETIPGVVSTIAGICGILAVMEMVGVIPGQFPRATGLNRAALGFGQPNSLGMFLALATPFTVYAWRTARSRGIRWIRGLAVIAVVAGLASTFSRGSWGAVLLGATALLLLGEKSFVFRIWAAAVLAAVVVDLLTGGAIEEAVFGVGRNWSIAQRLSLMAAGARLFLANPLLGVGPGGFAEELDRAQVLVPSLWDLQPTPHNAYLQIAAEAGVVGLIFLVVLLATSGVAVLVWARRDVPKEERLLRSAVTWGLAVAVVEGMVEWPLSHGHGQLVVLMMAMAFAASADSPREPPPPAVRSTVRHRSAHGEPAERGEGRAP